MNEVKKKMNKNQLLIIKEKGIFPKIRLLVYKLFSINRKEQNVSEINNKKDINKEEAINLYKEIRNSYKKIDDIPEEYLDVITEFIKKEIELKNKRLELIEKELSMVNYKLNKYKKNQP